MTTSSNFSNITGTLLFTKFHIHISFTLHCFFLVSSVLKFLLGFKSSKTILIQSFYHKVNESFLMGKANSNSENRKSNGFNFKSFAQK